MRIPIYCQICNGDTPRTDPIAWADTETLTVPMTGAMFDPPDARTPAPFHPALEWAELRCPWCQYRPFTEPDRVLTRGGIYVLGSRIPGPVQRVRPVWDDAELEAEWEQRYEAKVDPIKRQELRDAEMRHFRAEGWSFARIGKRFGLSGERVRQILTER